ncbi:hypothetical protein L0Y65_03155, partial [Candidatus Micrarchaeota archaeon]|nr:hypothetical protein [Candidatus Micrarchaeota archaeon]
MGTVQGQEPVKKEDGEKAKDIRSKPPLLEGLGVIGKAGRATALGISLVAALGIAKAGCTYEPFGLGEIDAGETGDGGHDAGPDADAGPDLDGGLDADGGPDADAGPDLDGGPDADGGPDLDGGLDADAGPAGCVGASEASIPSTNIMVDTPTVIGGYTFTYQGISGINAQWNIECAGVIFANPIACPVGVSTMTPDAASGTGGVE